VVTDDCKSLACFLDNSRKDNKRRQEFSLAKFEKTTFELLRKMHIIVGSGDLNDDFNALDFT
jgi:hypothetical protein